MRFPILPHIGVGALGFGMTADEVRRLLASPHTPFKKSLKSSIAADAFMHHTVHVFYSAEGTLEAIEFFGNADVTLNDKPLLSEPYSAILTFALSLDPDLREDDAGLKSYNLGVGIFAPHHIEYPNDPIESVIVFANGYYD